ncbi:uncharacterized protein RSE6_14266 [Rhynchosporium secalis]|uniref:Uncharacterized protein n=1 Tax=Rhynchosporium secalis TaxID=38038 RepID=A0A1E1MUW6_RHYSE|nr:uncharacterized protein RSE6_14266 [Rhynchosporium secalis]
MSYLLRRVPESPRLRKRLPLLMFYDVLCSITYKFPSLVFFDTNDNDNDEDNKEDENRNSPKRQDMGKDKTKYSRPHAALKENFQKQKGKHRKQGRKAGVKVVRV